MYWKEWLLWNLRWCTMAIGWKRGAFGKRNCRKQNISSERKDSWSAVRIRRLNWGLSFPISSIIWNYQTHKAYCKKEFQKKFYMNALEAGLHVEKIQSMSFIHEYSLIISAQNGALTVFCFTIIDEISLLEPKSSALQKIQPTPDDVFLHRLVKSAESCRKIFITPFYNCFREAKRQYIFNQLHNVPNTLSTGA